MHHLAQSLLPFYRAKLKLILSCLTPNFALVVRLVLDSWGKPGSSILRGNTMFLGNNAECTSVHHTDTATFADVQGRTCRMNIYLESLRSPMVSKTELDRNSQRDKVFFFSDNSERRNINLFEERGISNSETENIRIKRINR